jgi:ring-1,2-phenylacetyl-CoA epoxidase subunit PaaE
MCIRDRYSAHLNKDETILQALKKQQISVPYSCESGVCGTCQVNLKLGKVEMKANMVLEEKDVKAGKILCCQAIPKSDKIEIEL